MEPGFPHLGPSGELLGDGNRCIRDSQGRICAWLAGMSDEQVVLFLETYPGTYVSTAKWDKEKGMVV